MSLHLSSPFRLISVPVLCFGMFFISATTVIAQTADSTIFKDNFNRAALGNFWHQPTSWTIQDGAAYFFEGGARALKTDANYTQLSYVIETAAKGFTGSYYREFRLTFGQKNLSNNKTYVLSYKPYEGGRFILGRATDNVFYPETLDEIVLYPNLDVATWYKFKIARYKSGLIQVYVNRGSGYGTVPLLEAIDNTYTGLGHVGWETSTETFDEPFYVDWISAVKPGVEKPAQREKPTEDDLITQVSAESGKPYKVKKLTTGVKAYIDRDYTVTSVPAYLKGASFIQTAMDDKQRTDVAFLTSFIKQPAIIYIGYDPRAKTIPAWLSEWTKTGDRIATTDLGSSYLDVYSRLTEYGEVYPYPLKLGGNLAAPASGAQMNYLVAAIPVPAISSLEAEAAVVSGAVVATNHPGYSGTGFVDFKNASNDYIEWTVSVDVPGSYNLGFTFSNGGATSRFLQLKDNGSTLDTLEFTSIGSWSSWAFSSGPSVYLSRGVHKLRVTAIGTSGPNIDLLSFNYNGTSAAAAKATVQRTEMRHQVAEPSVKAYPNPFAQSTIITYQVAEKARVSLTLYSALGQPVQLLVNEIKDAGMYQETINGSKLAAGTYFYRLQIGSQVKVGKLVKL